MQTRIVLTVLTLGSSFTSFLAYTLLLRQIGTSADLDLLFYAGSVPLALAGISSGVLLYLLPPRFTQLEPAVQESTLRVLFFSFATVCALAVTVIVTYGILRGRLMLVAFWVGFTLVALLTVLSTLITCIAQARGAYLPTGVAPAIASTGLLVGVLVVISSHAEWYLLIGQLFGVGVSVVWLARSQKLTLVFHSRDLVLSRAALGPLRPHALAITLGTMAFTLFQPIDAALCSQLSSGSVSVMSYAQRVVVAISTAVSLGAHAVAARTSHDSLRTGGKSALIRMANLEVLRIISFGLLLWLGYVLGGQNFLGFLLGSSVMSNLDLGRLLDCVQWMLLGTGPMAAIPYLFRVFYSLQAYRKPALLGLFIAPTYGLLSFALLPYFDILAMAYSYSIVWWLALSAAMVWLNHATVDQSHPLQT